MFLNVKKHLRVSLFALSTVSLLLAYFAFLSTSVSPAQALTTVPTTMNFQGRLADSTGTIMPDGLYNMQFRLFTASSGGSAVWSETRQNNGTDTRVQVTNGLFSTKLGQVSPLSASLFASGSLYFEITMATPATATCSTNGCASWESPMTPRHQLSTSAYAYNAETLDGLDSSDFAAATGAAGYIQNGSSPQTASFNITGTGTAATIQAATFDRASTGTLTIGGTNATAITLADNTTVNANLTVAASNSLTLVGGNTASRPASPTEGMVYFDTTTKQLLTYANGKWQADKTDAVLVAASNSSQADKDAADYVADGNTAAANDGDQVQINNALTAAAGKKVVLLAGIYTADATILIPNNTMLAGIGGGTLIQLADIDVTDNLIENSDITTGTGVTIRDLKLDGQKSLNTAGTQHGIYLNNMGDGVGASARRGASVEGVVAINFRTWGIALSNSDNNNLINNFVQSNTNGIYITGSTANTVTANTAQGQTNHGIYLLTSTDNTLTANTTQNNTNNGIYLSSSTGNTVGDNTSKNNSESGISLIGSSYNTISSNYTQGNVAAGIVLESNSNNNSVVGNNSYDNGGATKNNGIYLWGSDANTITGNAITDTSGTTTNNAIWVEDVTSDLNYLSGNRFSSSAGTSVIADSGTGTIYANQSRAENGGQLTNRTANNTTAFTIQNASGANVLTADTTNGEIEIGSASLAGKLVISDGSSNTLTLSANALAGNYTVALPTITGNDTLCLASLGNCASASLYIQNQNASQQTASNYWISGSARADTSVTTPLLDTATAASLNIGTTNATSINLNENTTVASGKSLTLVGGATGTRPASPTEGMVYFDTTTKQLLTYANAKWQADRTDAIFVAASNSSQADKDIADYIGDGDTVAADDGDQVQINDALTAAAGKGVVLLAGTYVVDATVLVPNDTTLAGVGDDTLVRLADIDASDNVVQNADTSTGAGVVVRDMKIDGQKSLNTVGTQHGVYFGNMGDGAGASARRGGIVENVHAIALSGSGIALSSSNNNVIHANTVEASYAGILLDSSLYNAMDGNSVHDSGYAGILLQNSSSSNTITSNQVHTAAHTGIRMQSTSAYNTVTGNQVSGGVSYGIHAGTVGNTLSNNSVDSSATGIGLGSGSGSNSITANTVRNSTNDGVYIINTTRNTVSGNTIQNTTDEGVVLDQEAHNNILTGNVIETTGGSGILIIGNAGDEPTNNTVSDNSVVNSGGSTTNYGIDLIYAHKNTIANNRMSDDSCSGTCYAISIKATASSNYLANNVFNSTPGTAVLSDLGPDTVYSNQPLSENGGQLTNRSVNSTTAFQVQNASGTSLLTVDSSNTIIDVNAQLEVNFSSTATVNGVCHSGTDIDTTGTNRLLVACSAAPNDYAEFYPTDGNVEYGELVATTANMLTYEAQGADAETGVIESMGTKQISILKRAQAGDNVIGIVSTAPFQTIGKDIPVSANRMPIALSGRVPLKVTNENGAIGVGDKLTISLEIAGHATKAVTAGNTYAVALEPMNDETGMILVYVDNNYYAPPIQNAMNAGEDAVLGSMNIAGSINVMGDASFVNLTVAGDLTVEGALVVGRATAGELTVVGRITTKGATPTVDLGAALGTGETHDVAIEGTDGAGTLIATSAFDSTFGVIATISLAAPYESDYKILVSARDENAAKLRVYTIKTDTGFELRSLDALDPGTTYTFDYITQGAAPL